MDRLPEALEKYVGAAEHAHWADCSSRDTYDWMCNAILAFLNAAEKDGWAMVPREPTEEMLIAGDGETDDPPHFQLIKRIYRAMIDAAKEEGK